MKLVLLLALALTACDQQYFHCTPGIEEGSSASAHFERGMMVCHDGMIEFGKEPNGDPFARCACKPIPDGGK